MSFCSWCKQNCGKCCKDTSDYSIHERLICHDLNVLLFQINLSYILRSWKVKQIRTL
jgi:hypothetical protein